ncbi:serine/arginine repetitive matrix protein 2-like [Stegodyphus dumicola]|uniref:serine/arginine repetitive matrix protein 2-like n=1 Tax=Stegodyphus dumicola TaxID=202533 RepID=UPI0015A97B33|nr:serine/arginine repetitive matrix protein 2-like [Stegodyphus dumicola]
MIRPQTNRRVPKKKEKKKKKTPQQLEAPTSKKFKKSKSSRRKVARKNKDSRARTRSRSRQYQNTAKTQFTERTTRPPLRRTKRSAEAQSSQPSPKQPRVSMQQSSTTYLPRTNVPTEPCVPANKRKNQEPPPFHTKKPMIRKEKRQDRPQIIVYYEV